MERNSSTHRTHPGSVFGNLKAPGNLVVLLYGLAWACTQSLEFSKFEVVDNQAKSVRSGIR